MPAKNQKKRRTRVTPTKTSEVLDVKMAAELSWSHPIRSMTSSNAGSFPAGKSGENGSPPGMRCCAGSRVHRKTIYSSGPSNAVIGMSSPPPSNPARRRSRSRSKSVSVAARRRRLSSCYTYSLTQASPFLETMIKQPLYINAASHVYTGYHIKTYRIVRSPASHAIFAKDTLDRRSHTRYAALQ